MMPSSPTVGNEHAILKYEGKLALLEGRSSNGMSMYFLTDLLSAEFVSCALLLQTIADTGLQPEQASVVSFHSIHFHLNSSSS